MVCAGCGQELPPGGGRGRPARFHNSACRVRAHRARKASRHAAVLAGLDEVETAVVELRRTVLAGAPAGDAFARLTDATRRLLVPGLDLSSGAHEPIVTKRVTERVGCGPAEPGPEPGSTVETTLEPRTRRKTRDTTAGRQRSEFAPVRTVEPVDPDTVRLERDPAAPGWRVLAGLAIDPGTVVRVGTVEHARRGWRALNASLAEVSGGPWRTRTDAVVQLLMQHERAATASGR